MTHEEIFNAIYDWLGTLKTEEFQTYVREALSIYEPSLLNNITFRNRGMAVRDILKHKQLDAQQSFALILAEGGIIKTSFNAILLKHLLNCLNQIVPINVDDYHLNHLTSTIQSLARAQLTDLIWVDLLTGQSFSNNIISVLSKFCKKDIVNRLKSSPFGTSLTFLKQLKTNSIHPLALIINDGKTDKESKEFKLLMAHARALLNTRVTFFRHGHKKEENSPFNILPLEIKAHLFSFVHPGLKQDKNENYFLPTLSN